MRILVTGFSGFVSRHFVEYLETNAYNAEVLGISRHQPGLALDRFRHVRCSFRKLDLLDRAGVEEMVSSFRPSHVLHLAAYSSVGFSWQRPVESFANNTNISLNLLEQVRRFCPNCRVLSVGSSEQYGDVERSALPLREGASCRPVSPYGAARVAQEMLSSIYVRGYGLDIVMTRSFNHIGPYQRDVFVVPSLAKQLAKIRYRGAPPRLVTGDRSIVRDFVDVRDVVSAYAALFASGVSGEVYNICSGQGTSIDEVIAMMQQQLGTHAELEVDAALVRPSDNRAIIGSHDKITQTVGWKPTISLGESLASVVTWAQASLQD
jgi:GDP-4-dehydro-6-deoxy-D-mannose reductase